LILIGGVFACSLSVLFIKGSETDPIFLSAYRLLVGGALLLPVMFGARRRFPEFSLRRRWRGILAPSVLLALHFISWIAGARLTPSANATLLVNMTPVVMPLFLFLLVREVLTAREWAGTGLAMAGVLVLGLGDFNFDPQYALGDAVCFGSMLLYAAYLGFGSRNRDVPSIYLYVVPVYLIAGVVCLVIALGGLAMGLIERPIGPRLAHEGAMILGLAVLPTIVGHSIVNWAFKVLRGQVVSLLNLGQFVFAGITGYLILAEVPTPMFWVAVVLAVMGAVLVVSQRKPEPKREPTIEAPDGGV
jgi:drug/metabolite transporter (DMT)-like permease